MKLSQVLELSHADRAKWVGNSCFSLIKDKPCPVYQTNLLLFISHTFYLWRAFFVISHNQNKHMRSVISLCKRSSMELPNIQYFQRFFFLSASQVYLGTKRRDKILEINNHKETYFPRKRTPHKCSLAGNTRNAYSPHRQKLVEKREIKLVRQEYNWETFQSIFSER